MNANQNRYETRGVLAGAYKGKSASLKATLGHVVEVDAATDREVRVLCGRIPLDHIVDSGAGGLDDAPTCPVCTKRDPRRA